jgi:hypothetical protein
MWIFRLLVKIEIGNLKIKLKMETILW